jgi:uncharacterized DUF497 family protein
MALQFEWDARKAKSNRAKHGISFEEAITVFADSLARIFEDPEHSEGEPREIIVGRSGRGNLLLVSFVERNDRVRLISARKATRMERKDYEENGSRQEETD